MANTLIKLMLWKQELPQLSDSDLTILDNSHLQTNDPIDLDCFDLDILNDVQVDQLNENQFYNQNNEFYIDQTNSKYNKQFDLDTVQSNFIDHEQSQQYLVYPSSQYTSSSFSNLEITNDPSNEFIESNFANCSNEPSYTLFSPDYEVNSQNHLIDNSSMSNVILQNQYIDSHSFTNEQFADNQLIDSSSWSTDQSCNQSIGYLNQVVNSPIDNSMIGIQTYSPVDCYSNHQTNSPADYQTINSPNDYSIQSVNSSIDYSAHGSVSTYQTHSCSLTNSPSSTGLSPDSSDYCENNDFLNYSTHSSSCDQFSRSNVLNAKPTKSKRKRSKKVVSEEEVQRKLELKAERRRRRLERKKVQNKEAARRYREKKRMEENEINARLKDAKERFRSKQKCLKEALNEKKVLIKLLKDFADQSHNFKLPEWVMKSDFSNSSLL